MTSNLSFQRFSDCLDNSLTDIYRVISLLVMICEQKQVVFLSVFLLKNLKI